MAGAMLPAFADEAAALRKALDLGARGQWGAALVAAPAGVARDVVLWSKLRAGEGNLGEYEDFLRRRADWPGLALLREKGETAVARSVTPSRIAAYFAGARPVTAAGAIVLVRALLTLDDRARAETEAMQAWAELSFAADEERELRALLPGVVARVDGLRLENLLWAGRRAEAERMLARVDAATARLARVRLALRADAPGVDAMIGALSDADLRHPGLRYERFAFRMRRDDYDGAAAFLLSIGADGLGRPAMWAPRRALLAHRLMRDGRVKDAYRIASAHGLAAGGTFADLEFLSGFLALRRLGQPDVALAHFTRLREGVSTPISLARAAYWQGRAEEALGHAAKADARYHEAARHQTAYYGLLAAERLGIGLDPALIVRTLPGGWQEARFAASSAFAAGRLLQAAGNRGLARLFFLHLAEGADERELAHLARMALDLDEPHIALAIAKHAAGRGIILPAAYFPVPRFVPDGLRVTRALALAVTRRESEFNPAARSHADARGLMQLLPATGALVARDLALDYAAGRLISDPGLNVTLGAAYLARMVEEFGPSVALIASGYNAGPNRPRRWLTDFGDPRSRDVDVVDWVEMIPFAETRSYVMRVAEALVIYRAILKGKAGPIRLTAELKG